MKVLVTVCEATLEGDGGRDIEGVRVTCDRCEHSVEVFGTDDRSVRRGCVMLREECPQSEENFYTEVEA